MRTRRLGRTGFGVSEVGFGAWAIGGDAWGPADDDASMAALHAAADAGVTFFDTADVYGDGHSERLLARLRRERGPGAGLVIATKVGRRGPLDPAAYTAANLAAWVDRCRENLEADTLDLVQLHCPPPAVYGMDGVYDALDALVDRGRIAHYGVSVERVEEGLEAVTRPGVATVQIILNAFRQRPAERFLDAAAEAGVGVIARVPLASGLLSGRMGPDTAFAPTDHRSFNRRGEAFDVGETFAGVDYAAGLAAVEELRPLVPPGWTMAQMAIRWVLDQPGVSSVIPGARTPEQARANAAVSDLPPLAPGVRSGIAGVYRRRIAPLVGERW